MPNLNYSGPIQPEENNKAKNTAHGTKTKSSNTSGKLVVVIIGAVILFAVGIIAIVFWATSGVTSAADDFLTAIGNGEIEQAYESTSVGFKQVGDVEMFEEFINENPVLKNYESSFFTTMGVEGDTFGTAGGTVTAKDGQVSPIYLELVKENEEWKVLSIDFNIPSSTSIMDDDFDDF